jgi:prepilin-type N-terminal cleavage/methylation domain-containing protein/prepilin-type processing-associated H-X9-DG protein
MRKCGYTLIELLVVVAIIAILAAMIAPVLMQAKDSARMQVCSSNLRHLGQAILRYMDDNSGFGLPPAPDPYKNPWILYPEPLCPRYTGQRIEILKPNRTPPPNPNGSWLPYGCLPGQEPKLLWICPGDIAFGPKFEQKPCWWIFGSSYMYPGPTAYQRSTDPLEQNRKMARGNIVPLKPVLWKTPKRDILLADVYGDFHGGERDERYTEAVEKSLMPAMYIKTRSFNILFLDGHVKAATRDERIQFQQYTCDDDNPYKSPGKP